MAEINKLASAIRTVLAEAIKYHGTTFNDDRDGRVLQRAVRGEETGPLPEIGIARAPAEIANGVAQDARQFGEESADVPRESVHQHQGRACCDPGLRNVDCQRRKIHMIVMQSRDDQGLLHAGQSSKDNTGPVQLVALDQAGHDGSNERNAGLAQFIYERGQFCGFRSCDQDESDLVGGGPHLRDGGCCGLRAGILEKHVLPYRVPPAANLLHGSVCDQARTGRAEGPGQ